MTLDELMGVLVLRGTDGAIVPFSVVLAEAGFALVPLEPTDKMLSHAHVLFPLLGVEKGATRAVWKTMIKAAAIEEENKNAQSQTDV